MPGVKRQEGFNAGLPKATEPRNSGSGRRKRPPLPPVVWPFPLGIPRLTGTSAGETHRTRRLATDKLVTLE
jgi:hypothetical protein